MMVQATKEKMEMKEKISQLENKLLRLKEEEITPLQHEDYSDTVVQATAKAGECSRDADISHLEKAEQKEEEKKEEEEKAKEKEDMSMERTK